MTARLNDRVVRLLSDLLGTREHEWISTCGYEDAAREIGRRVGEALVDASAGELRALVERLTFPVLPDLPGPADVPEGSGREPLLADLRGGRR
jgi:hypothetical protein